MNELQKPDAALFLRERAIERFPGFDVAESIPLDQKVMLLERPMVLLYSMDVARLTDVTWTETIGYRIFAGSREYPDVARNVGRQVEAWLWGAWKLPGYNPVTAATDTAGPNLIADEHETAVLFGTVEMVIAGVYHPAQSG